jgi:ADP-ribose 1''-phosphate phosphatase
MGIIYKAGSLFQATAGSNHYLVHATNCVGVWGAGVAKQMAEKYAYSYTLYKNFCSWSINEGFYPMGTFFEADNVVSLFTSKGFGDCKDSPDKILKNTHSAVADLFHENSERETHFHSPKINAGLFNVPWEKTEEIIENALKYYPEFTWTVYLG